MVEKTNPKILAKTSTFECSTLNEDKSVAFREVTKSEPIFIKHQAADMNSFWKPFLIAAKILH